MRQVKIRLNPTLDEDHTEVTITCSLPRQLTAWEMRDLCEMLGARSGKSVRVVLPAVGASEWLDGWSTALAEAVTRRMDVQFVIPRRSRRRQAVCGDVEAQLEVPMFAADRRRPRRPQ